LDGSAFVGVSCVDMLALRLCQHGVRSMRSGSRDQSGNTSPMAERLCLQHSSRAVLLCCDDAILGVEFIRPTDDLFAVCRKDKSY
jgi:hypothetical protein